MAALFASLSGSPTIEMNHWARAQMIAEHRREELHILYSQLSENLTAQKPSIEEKVLRAIRIKVNPKSRDIQQFTKLLAVDVQLAINHLFDDGLIGNYQDGDDIRYVIAKPINQHCWDILLV